MSFPRVVALAMLFGAGLASAQAPAPVLLGDAAAGEGKSAVCGACHGADGNSALAMYPKLAGQNESYIVRQLTQFKDGKRVNAIMQPFASTLSAQDMHDVGAYFASKRASAGEADEAYVQRAEQLYRAGDSKIGVPACMSCHGPTGRGMACAAYAQLAGQWSEYIALKLTEWRDGTTWGDDEHAAVMPAIAKRLSDKDIAALASYVQGLHEVQTASAK